MGKRDIAPAMLRHRRHDVSVFLYPLDRLALSFGRVLYQRTLARKNGTHLIEHGNPLGHLPLGGHLAPMSSELGITAASRSTIPETTIYSA
jgi:hypothetical protein